MPCNRLAPLDGPVIRRSPVGQRVHITAWLVEVKVGGHSCALFSADSRRVPCAAMLDNATASLTGWTGSPDYFRFEERTDFDPSLVLQVLRGELAGVVFRGFASSEGAAQILRQFHASPDAVARTDDAAGVYLGAYHYHKTTSDYLRDAEQLSNTLDGVLMSDASPWRAFREQLGAALDDNGIEFRTARSGDKSACIGAVRSWAGKGTFALVPHEDGSQCRHPGQVDFEIQQALNHQICATNLCLENEGAGRLFYWNVKPDDASKRALGTYLDGGPYPADLLDGYDMIKLPVNTGDLYIFNGGHIHAVEHATGARSTASCILGFVDKKTVVSWT